MKKILCISLLITLLSSCKTRTVYVPVESTRTEYKDRVEKEHIYFYDSVFMKMQNDTVWLEKYKYLYKDRLVTDSVIVTDSIAVPYPVVEIQETNRLNSFQNFQIWCGRILIGFVMGWLVVKYVRKGVF